MRKLLLATAMAVLPFSVSATEIFHGSVWEEGSRYTNVGNTTFHRSASNSLANSARGDRIDIYTDFQTNSSGQTAVRTRIYDFARGERSDVRGLDNFSENQRWIERHVYANEPGLEKAHRNGWTGKDQKIHLLEVEGSYHGTSVENHADVIAPGAEIFYHDRSELHPGSSNDIRDHYTGVDNELSAAFVIAKSIRIPDVESFFRRFPGSQYDALQRSEITKVHAAQDSRRFGRYNDCSASKNSIAECNTNYNSGFTNESNIYVGALNRDGSLSPSTIYAGEAAKDQYIVTTGTFGTGTGSTSFAAPRVAGALALVRQKFPNLNHKQSREVILKTADDLGAPGNDPIYGVGRLNISKALNPYGRLR